jgi:hypothetical protein
VSLIRKYTAKIFENYFRKRHWCFIS